MNYKGGDVMKGLNRYIKYRDEDFDKVLLLIRNGTIKAGRYAHLVKVDEDVKLKGGVYFEDNSNESE